MPYRDIRPEYPPGALPAFVLPALVSDDEESYRDAFEWLMAACGAALVLLTGVALAGLRASRTRTVVGARARRLLPASARLRRAHPLRSLAGGARRGRTRRTRPRTLPARLRRARRCRRREALPGRPRPVAAAYVWRRRGRREALVCLGLLAAVVALVFLPFLVVAPGGVAHSIGRQLSRPLQIESLGSALYLAAHHLLGLHVEMRSGHGSQNLHATGTGVAAALFSLIQLRSTRLDLATPSDCSQTRAWHRGARFAGAPRLSWRSLPSGRCSRRSS